MTEWPIPPTRSKANAPGGMPLSVAPTHKTSKRTTLICFSHLRWDFVHQRPQHLMTRLAADYDVLFWEEPVESSDGDPTLDIRQTRTGGVTVLTPRLSLDLSAEEQEVTLRRLIRANLRIPSENLIKWYYTPMMLPFSRHLEASCTVYDCMDELANFSFAPTRLKSLEEELLGAADVVFTGGFSLFDSKKAAHDNIHLFASSVDRAHFASARTGIEEPTDQADLPHPRIGYCGVIDERIDLSLIEAIADAHPEWSLVMIGPVVKIDPASLPRRRNIAYLGMKDYAQLPAYQSGWDVAIMPFALNAATRFISPTKTPEYLAGGRPVVSSAIADVKRQYGHLDGVIIADDAKAFVQGCERAMRLPSQWLSQTDETLAELSWDRTVRQMDGLIHTVRAARATPPPIARLAPPVRRAPKRRYDYMIVGAGFAGSVLAERLASVGGKSVLLIDRRPHIGGNAYDHHDAAGILVHRYGPHIFHTNSADIFNYLSRFTTWRPYEHRVLANLGDRLAPLPINRTTINTLYGLSLQTEEDTRAFLASRAVRVDPVRTAADAVISQVGQDLYETFFRGYTRKQWGLDPTQLDKSVTARVPARFNEDDRYFTDSYQYMPSDGYTAMFENMLDHDNIDIRTDLKYDDADREFSYDHLIFTGRIDDYFGRRYGELPYRSLKFDHATLDRRQFQGAGTVNYPSEFTPYTRITEFKHLTGQNHEKTSIVYEYPCGEGDPYYPVPRDENQTLFKRYEILGRNTPAVTFVGRLATYRYYNMDQVVGQALSTFRRLSADFERVSTPSLRRVSDERGMVGVAHEPG